MSLTLGHGPLSARPADSNYEIRGPKHRLFIEDSPKRVRVKFGDVFVVDTRGAKLLHETGQLPVYYFPKRDVLFEHLSQTSHSTTCPFKGSASYFTVQVNGKLVENVAWAYLDALDEVHVLRDHIAFYLDRADAVYEENERLIGHPRDPYHRVDSDRSTAHVRVLIDGELIAETLRPRAVFETGLPVRWYVPQTDVRMERLAPSPKRTVCPYKGIATYWSMRGKPGEVAWAYEEPLPEGAGLSRHLSFDGEGVVVVAADD